MLFSVFIDSDEFPIDVPESLVSEAEEFFQQIDRDMDRGYQMSRTWVQSPDQIQRCQIVADRLLTALDANNRNLGVMMAAYILSRMPMASGVHLSTEGEMQDHELIINQRPQLNPV